MGRNLQEFINTRRAELQQEKDKIEMELMDLDAVESIVGSNSQLASPISNSDKSSKEPEKLTIKQMIVSVLSSMPNGATALEVIDAIYRHYGVRIIRTSMSPQLSRMGSEGALSRRENRWFLNEAAKNKRPG